MSNKDRMDLAAGAIYTILKNAEKYDVPALVAMILSSLLDVLKWQDDIQEVESDDRL